jgi:hypothetical protein
LGWGEAGAAGGESAYVRGGERAIAGPMPRA